MGRHEGPWRRPISWSIDRLDPDQGARTRRPPTSSRIAASSCHSTSRRCGANCPREARLAANLTRRIITDVRGSNPRKAATRPAEQFDVLIVGAGISGVGGAYHLTTSSARAPASWCWRAQETFGGTWWTHRYPGIRSDSDLLHLRLPLQALDRRADRHRGRDPQVHGRGDRGERPRPAHPLQPQDQLGASWSSADNRWTIEATRTDTGETVRFTANFLWMCQGYYRHSEGYTPEWPGMDRFKGPIVHPQTWPEDLDYKGKRVVVIGSGATAATIVPAMARRLPRMSPCCSARRPISAPAATPSRSPTSCASCRSTRPGSTRSSAARSCSSRPNSPSAASTSRSR